MGLFNADFEQITKPLVISELRGLSVKGVPPPVTVLPVKRFSKLVAYFIPLQPLGTPAILVSIHSTKPVGDSFSLLPQCTGVVSSYKKRFFSYNLGVDDDRLEILFNNHFGLVFLIQIQ